jgi:pilus assembly protein CpaC
MAITGFRKGLLILLLCVAGGGTILWAQSPLPASAVMAATPAPETDGGAVRLMVGRSAVLDIGSRITRVSLTSADIADALVTSPQQLLINGKMPGTISMFVWDTSGTLRRYEVIVQRDLARLSEQLRELLPGERIDVNSNGKNVILSGSVSSKDVIEKATNIASGYVGSKEEVVALLQLQPGAPSNQVLLRVRFAEVSRNALMELGISGAANGYKDGRWFGRATTGQFPAPEWDEEGRFVFSDFLNLFLFDTKNQLAGVVRALSNKGLFQSLAEPNLVAESGKEASFLAGGEIPIPVAQGSGANIGVSVTFKEFGIRLTFTPTVIGNRVHLKVKPEVSTLDFANSVVLAGFRIPALSTRRTETELELENGQTFAIAGLMNNTVRSSLQKIPGIGDIPILGLLFRSKAAQKDTSELVVMITPQILPNNSSGVTPTLPRVPEEYLDAVPDNRLHPQPPPAYTAPRPGADARPAAAAPVADSRSGQAPSASSAAAAVTALAPGAPRLAEPTPPVAASAPAPQAAGPGATASPEAAPAPRPLTEQEKKAIERARKQEQEQAQAELQATLRARAIEGRRIAEQQAEEKKTAEKEQERQAVLAREQARRDAEQAKRDGEAARRQAEKDREQQKLIDEAAARLKAAEALYNAEVEKKNKR